MSIVEKKASLFKKSLLSQRAWLSTLIIFSIGINLLAVVPSIYMLQIYDRVLTSQSHSTLLALTVLIVGLYALAALLEHHRNCLLIRIGDVMEEDLISTIHTAAFHRALHTQGKDNTGQAIRDFSLIRQFITSQGAIALLDAPWVLFYLVLLFMFHPWFGVMALCCIAIAVLLSWLHIRHQQTDDEHAGQWAIRSANVMNSTLYNANSIQAMGMLPQIQSAWLSIQKRHTKHHTAASESTSAWTSGTKYFRVFVQSATLGLGAYLVLEQQLSGGMMIAASILMGKALGPIDTLTAARKTLGAVQSAFNRLNQLLEHLHSDNGLHSLPAPEPCLSFQNMYVKAPLRDTWLLRNVHLTIPSGCIVGVIGPSGAGKTSLLHSISGILPITQGRLQLNGADLTQYTRSLIGQHTGYLAQQVELFEGTVAENISRFQQNREELVLSAAKAAGVHELILTLPLGYNTPLGGQGEGLSGGMRQRVGLARALFGNPNLLLLDEPNAHLDDEGDAALAKALLSHRQQGGTAILVTHKKSVIQTCDRLLVLGNGEVVMYGKTTEVLQRLQKGTVISSSSKPNV